MFYDASPGIFEKARKLRENMTTEEKLLWDELKENKLDGMRFKPQHPIDVYVADFYCHKLKLVIEVDGENHGKAEQKDYDIGRTEELNKLGIEVIRFSNEEVNLSMNRVVEEISVKSCIHLQDHDNKDIHELIRHPFRGWGL